MTTKKLFLIHHSHTDIGYTDRQEKISRYHVDFIKSVLKTLAKIERGEADEWQGFKYTCENFWQVEQFLKHSNEEEQAQFHHFVEKGWLDISLSYLNMTELVDADILAKKFQKGHDYVQQYSREFDSAMTADINGFSWGYAEAMVQKGIKNLYSCLHTHHGMFPLFKKQLPFWWETPSGEKLLVWNGDHYQTGNDFLFVPNSDQSKVYDQAGYTQAEADRQFKTTEERIFRHFDLLEKEGYAYDFVPAMISGIVTDNAPSNPRMMEVIHRWNETHGNEIEVELVTLNEFFAFLHTVETEFPTYSGDWPDWWADGVGSTPAATKIYRSAQRKYHLAQKLDAEERLGDPALLEAAEDQMMMYAEHTWGYHSSVGEPWDTFVNELDSRKIAYAVNGHSFISQNLDEILANMGEESIQMNRDSFYRVINPHELERQDYGKIYIKHWETVDDSYMHTSQNDFLEVVDCLSGEVIESQVQNTSRGKEISFPLKLKAKESRLVKLRRKEPQTTDRINWNHASIGTELVEDLASYGNYEHKVSSYSVETDDFHIRFDQNKGIASIVDRVSQKELIHPDVIAAPFSGVYEVTPITTDPSTQRRIMGRNRKSQSTKRYFSTVKNIQVVENGPLYVVLELDYELVGTKLYTLVLTVYQHEPRIEARIRLHKTSEWAPENLYIALPFTLGEESELFFQKSGAIIRPGIDQLPGTNTDFYLLDNGLAYHDGRESLIVAMKDTPLVSVGTLDSQLIQLAEPGKPSKNKELVYSWAMNNFWETNFKVDLAGFYELDYLLYIERASQTIEDDFETAADLSQEFITIDYNPTPEELKEIEGV